MTIPPILLAAAPDRDIAAAALVAEDGRYLLQLRDAKPHIHLPDHWTLFGGGIEAGETPEQALRRELSEELRWQARAMYPVLTSVHAAGYGRGVWRLHFHAVPFELGELAAMVQMEGAAKAMFTLHEIFRLERLAPWDLCAVMIHARAGSLFG